MSLCLFYSLFMGKLGKFYRKQCRYWDGDESFYDSSEGKQQSPYRVEYLSIGRVPGTCSKK
jgi:hypothetical protein